MFAKIATALAIIVGISSGALAATRQNSGVPKGDTHDCRGVYVGSDPRILINRPRNGMCDSAE
jgi:hypothetical protein